MKLAELVAQGVRKVWRPPWVATSYLELDLLQAPDGRWVYGPWAHVHDTSIEAQATAGDAWAKDLVDACRRRPLFAFGLDDDDAWQPWPPTPAQVEASDDALLRRLEQLRAASRQD